MKSFNLGLKLLAGKNTVSPTSTANCIHAKIFVNIPQGSFISPVLYLFYNVDLLNAYENIRLRTSPSGFVDDVNIMVHGTSTESNCRALESIYIACEEWAKRHGSKFGKDKYELIHFLRTPRRFNMRAALALDTNVISPSADIRVLGVRPDSALRWRPHLRAVEAQLVHQVNALKTITGSTWGASLDTGCRVYNGMIRPTITFGCNAWYAPAETRGYRKDVAAKLQSMQGKCLRVITGAYKATSTEALEIETFTPPLDLFTEHTVARATTRLLTTRTRDAYEAATTRIRSQARGRRGRAARAPITPAVSRQRWLVSQVGEITRLELRQPYIVPPWSPLPAVEIAPSKEEAVRLHDSDTHGTRLRVYCDGSGINGRITAAAVADFSESSSIVGSLDDAQVYHGEFEGIAHALRMLVARTAHEAPGAQLAIRSAVIYVDNQAVLKALNKGDPLSSQGFTLRVLSAVDTLRNRNVNVLLRWIPGHVKVHGNEKAD